VLVRVAMPEFMPLDHCVELSFISDVRSAGSKGNLSICVPTLLSASIRNQ
jgi:hypothetical protein